MVLLSIIIMAFTLIQFVVALTNYIFRKSLFEDHISEEDLVSVLIPARNEEINLPSLLSDLQKQDYKNLEIVVFDDQSTDRTKEIVTEFSRRNKRIKYYYSDALPSGWLGKNYACHLLSTIAQGNYYLFLDADVRIGNRLISSTLTYLNTHKLKLLSIFPLQRMETFGEKITVPNMNYILLTLLPLILIRKTQPPSLSAANGQFMLFEASTYQKVQPHKAAKDKKAEDIEISRLYKIMKERIACITGNHEISCRMYTGLQEAISGFSKNVVMFFGNSFILAILFWLVTTFGFIVILIGLTARLFLIYVLLFLVTRMLVSITSRQPVVQNLLLIIPQQITLGMMLLKALNNHRTKNYEWKGRSIYS
ncbi:MAG TPA: glycosyltransferase [Mariniphaga sp.]|nr:glycosyltransferase [Mariniphaga sp.]